jgi:hypothetical protein
VKFSPEEMAYDLREAEGENWIPIGRGWKAFEQFRKWKRQMARLEPDVRKAFPDDQAVNRALRKLIEAMPAQPRKRRSA